MISHYIEAQAEEQRFILHHEILSEAAHGAGLPLLSFSHLESRRSLREPQDSPYPHACISLAFPSQHSTSKVRHRPTATRPASSNSRSAAEQPFDRSSARPTGRPARKHRVCGVAALRMESRPPPDPPRAPVGAGSRARCIAQR